MRSWLSDDLVVRRRDFSSFYIQTVQALLVLGTALKVYGDLQKGGYNMNWRAMQGQAEKALSGIQEAEGLP